MHVAVVGAGLVGLSTAWYLRDRGAQVTVFDKDGPGAGASWGNAGQVVPAMALPLAEPDNLRYALRSLWKKDAPVTAPRSMSRDLAEFLLKFARNSTHRRFAAGLADMMNLNLRALDGYEYMETNGVDTTRRDGPFTSAFINASGAEHLMNEYADATAAGFPVDVSFLTGDELRRREPLVGDHFRFGVELGGQSLLEPPKFIANLVASLESDIEIRRETEVKVVAQSGTGASVGSGIGAAERFDAVVLATGAWLTGLAREHGVTSPVVAGRGYSMSVSVPQNTRGMLYFAESRIATTAYGERLRVTSLLQMGPADEAPRERSRLRFLRTAKAVLPQLDWNSAREFWSGCRPLSVDGKPVIGRTTTPGVFVNGGHGMWGVTLAPISGRVIADMICGNDDPDFVQRFDPMR